MDAERMEQLSNVYRTGLLSDTIPFWLSNGVDTEHGGFFSALDRQGEVIDTDKSVWHQGRMTWMLAQLYNDTSLNCNDEQRRSWLQAAKSGSKFLEDHCFDPQDDRMWFHVTRDGRPIRKRRYAFTESFAAIAFGEIAKATQDARYQSLAAESFRSFLRHQPEPKLADTRPTRGIGHPMITIGTAQELRDSIDLPEANTLIDDAIETIERYHMKPDQRVVMESVGQGGEILDHFDGRLLNPGHAIEAAWFVLREADYRGDTRLQKLGTDILDWMWEWGWDEEHGGIIYFRDLMDKPPQEYWHDMKFWWPQNEAIIATLYAYKLTGDPKYADWHQQIHDWAHLHFADATHGEWYGYLHRDGRISQTSKGNLWKGCFHHPRMQHVCWQLLAAMEKEQPEFESR